MIGSFAKWNVLQAAIPCFHRSVYQMERQRKLQNQQMGKNLRGAHTATAPAV